MKQKLLITGLICGLFFMISCFSSRQPAAFRQMKKAADTLIVINPYLEMTAFDFRENTPDSALTEQNRELITKVTNQILSSRYALKHIDMPDIDRDKFLAMCYDFDHSSGSNKSMKRQTFFPALGEIDHNKVAMFISFHAEYNTMTRAVTSNSMFGTSSVRVTPAARPRSDIRLMVFNLQTDEIIFYKRYKTRNFNASLPDDVERMTRKMLRDIYYK